ncbi:MAG: PqqD family protein [Clostridia bacterium]|nr:PqqD family protein [Clostridia bacterium]
MKLSENFVLRQIAGDYYVFPVGGDAPEGIFALNATGLLIWQGLEQGEDHDALVRRITEEYAVSADQAAKDLGIFLEKLASYGCLEEDKA